MIDFIIKCIIAGVAVIITAAIVCFVVVVFRIAYERIKWDDKRKHELLK